MAHMSSEKQDQRAFLDIKIYHRASAIKACTVSAEEQVTRTPEQKESTVIVTVFMTIIQDKGGVLNQLIISVSLIDNDSITGHPSERKAS